MSEMLMKQDTISAVEAEWQGRKFVDFTRRGGDAGLWWRSKDFTREQKVAIRAQIKQLIAQGQ